MNIRLIILPLVLFSFTQCCPTKNGFQKRTPFTIATSFYQDWVGGQAGASGLLLQVHLENIKDDVQPEFIYFKNKKEKIAVKKSEKASVVWLAHFSDTNKNTPKKDVIMHADHKKEFGNTPPQILTNLPFELGENEAVISYQYKGKLAYYKLIELTKKETLFYPTAKPKP